MKFLLGSTVVVRIFALKEQSSSNATINITSNVVLEIVTILRNMDYYSRAGPD